MTDKYNSTDPVEVAPGVFHLGVQDSANSFNNIPYVVVDGDDAVVIDPGSARPDFYGVFIKKLKAAVDIKKVKHIVVQHQDPDLCAALPLLEKEGIHPDAKVYAPLESKVLLQHYAFSTPLHAVEDDGSLSFGNGRALVFAMIPYCHFIGAMVTYDVKTKTLFSSDAFGGFTGDCQLYAGPDYPVQLTTFLGQYLGSKRALEYALKRVEKLNGSHGIDLVCPQHGCIIKKEQIPAYLEAAHNLEVGGEVEALAKKHNINLD